jgi:DNA-binding NtrC family response regulator
VREPVSKKVLLIGDDTPFMEALVRRIEANSLSVHLAQDAPEALAILQQQEIEVAVLNLRDLADEGIQLLISIKKRIPLTECITLTGPSTMHWSIESMKQGAFADLLIPFDNENLLAKLREAVAKRESKKRQRKRSLLKRIEDLMVSATFAESGSFDAARQILGENREPGPKGKKGAS